MNYGLDVLGCAKFADLTIREHPQGWSIGAFSEIFGNSFPVVEHLLKAGRAPTARIQLQWRDSHVFSDKDIKITEREARKWAALAKEFGRCLRISPWCEHNARLPLLNKLHDAVMNILPDCQYVNSPWQGDFMPKVWNEVHGTKRPPRGDYIFSYDGTSAVDTNVEQFKRQHSRCQTFYFWVPAFNGRLRTTDKTPRPQRKSWPTSELIDSVIYLHNERGQTRLPRTHIWKTHADRHETPPEARAYKPVLIAPEKANRAELVADNSQVVAVSQSRLPFNDGRFRYYFSEYGYQLAEKAIRIQGHPVVRIRIGKRFVGKVNPAFRAGSFRD